MLNKNSKLSSNCSLKFYYKQKVLQLKKINLICLCVNSEASDKKPCLFNIQARYLEFVIADVFVLPHYITSY